MTVKRCGQVKEHGNCGTLTEIEAWDTGDGVGMLREAVRKTNANIAQDLPRPKVGHRRRLWSDI